MDIIEAEPVLLAEPVPGAAEDAARLLESALRVGAKDPEVAYLLGLCYKKLGKIAEARAAFRKIDKPDANVILQMGLLSFGENQFAQAEQEFARAAQMDPACYPAAYNLLLARLSLGNVEGAAAQLPALLTLAPNEDERHFLGLLGPLLETAVNVKKGAPPPLPGGGFRGAIDSSMTPDQEQRLLALLGGLGQFEAVFPLLQALAQARPHSSAVQEAFLEAVLVQGKKHADRGEWDQAETLLLPLARQPADNVMSKPVLRANHLALHNLLGCCEAMQQNYDQAVTSYQNAARLAPNDPWIQQNLALACEWRNRYDQADTHWNRYFELLDHRMPTPSVGNYREDLTYEALSRLADGYSKRDQFATALPYLQRASRLRPNDMDTLERLFHLYNQAKRPEDARRTLQRLRELRPHEPQFELYELDLREIRSLEDMERILADIRKTLARFPADMRVEERAVNLVNNFIPVIVRMSDQLTDRLNHIVDQMRRLANHQINWQAVREEMADLIEGYRRLKRVMQKSQTVVNHEDHRRVIRDLCEQMDRKIELCQSMGG